MCYYVSEMGASTKTVLLQQFYDRECVVPYLKDEAILKVYSDVLLISKNDECFPVNKLFLASCSPMFEKIMKDIEIEGEENCTLLM